MYCRLQKIKLPKTPTTFTSGFAMEIYGSSLLFLRPPESSSYAIAWNLDVLLFYHWVFEFRVGILRELLPLQVYFGWLCQGL